MGVEEIQPQTQREINTIIYDIACPHIPGTENPKQYSPSVLQQPQKHWLRNQFYSSLTSHLANLGHEKLQNSNYQKESPLADVFNDAYSLHTIQGDTDDDDDDDEERLHDEEYNNF
ncbi:hypothetical protein ACTFIZ_006631 [Dictyostelium cf. discoideum]